MATAEAEAARLRGLLRVEQECRHLQTAALKRKDLENQRMRSVLQQLTQLVGEQHDGVRALARAGLRRADEP